MFDSAILDVVIGLFFVYAVLSLVCSAITELIAQLFKMRAQTLEHGIRRLLGDVKLDGTNIVDKFYSHHLIASLSKSGAKPSYIPSRTVALTLLSLVGSEGDEDTKKMKSLRDNLKEFGGENSPVAEALGALLDQAGNSLEKGVANVEHWIDDQMDRVSGWYRQWTQWVLLVVGLVVCTAVNADTLKIVSDLYNDPAYREQIVASAAQRIAQMEDDAGAQAPADLKTTLDKIRGELREVQPLVGWSKEECKHLGKQPFRRWVGKVIGLILTAFAVSLGAPFWFNALQKLLQIRGSVKPEKSAAQAGE